MIQDDDSPHISAADLREALRSGQSTRHRGLAQLVADTSPEPEPEPAAPAPDADADADAAHAEVMALRASVATLSERVEALESDNEERRERELSLRGALRQLALARGRRRRRTVVDELRAQGLL